MASEVVPDEIMTDRGRGPEIIGTRITVYNLLPDFLDPTSTEELVCRLYNLTPLQVSAARAYIMNHWEEVWAQHLKIEARIAVGNPPEILEKANQIRPRFLEAKATLERRRKGESQSAPAQAGTEFSTPRKEPIPSFVEWLADQQSDTSLGT